MAVGESLEVQIAVDTSGREVASLPFYVRYDPLVLRLLEVRQGPFLASSGRSVLFQSNIQEGTAVVGEALAGTGRGASGSGVLATLVFQGITPGRSSITVDNADPTAPGGGSLPVSAGGGSLTVH